MYFIAGLLAYPVSNIPQQFINPHFASRFLVHLFDDYGAVEAVFAVGGGQVAGDDDGAGGDAAVEDFAGHAVVDAGAGADVDAHRDDRAFFDDDAFHDFGAGADEAIVLDDGGAGLDWLNN